MREDRRGHSFVWAAVRRGHHSGLEEMSSQYLLTSVAASLSLSFPLSLSLFLKLRKLGIKWPKFASIFETFADIIQ